MIQPPFKIIALRILKGCAPDIHKCLHIDMFYYLSNDYVISEDGTTIKRASSYIEPVADDFFSILKWNFMPCPVISCRSNKLNKSRLITENSHNSISFYKIF